MAFVLPVFPGAVRERLPWNRDIKASSYVGTMSIIGANRHLCIRALIKGPFDDVSITGQPALLFTSYMMITREDPPGFLSIVMAFGGVWNDVDSAYIH